MSIWLHLHVYKPVHLYTYTSADPYIYTYICHYIFTYICMYRREKYIYMLASSRLSLSLFLSFFPQPQKRSLLYIAQALPEPYTLSP